MTKLAELRAAIEAIRCEICGSVFGVTDALTALDALEQALREDVLYYLDEGFFEGGTELGDTDAYDIQSINFAHRKLAEILDSQPTPAETAKEVTQADSEPKADKERPT